MNSSPHVRLERARHSLEGLSTGDAFGERFFAHSNTAHLLIRDRALPAPVWRFTDDTQMALSIYAVLKRNGTLDQDSLATSFGTHYDISRGYGRAMHRLLPAIRNGIHWSRASRDLFGGQGSFGNGSAMRVAPLGAYFADDWNTLEAAARQSAEVTHAHPEAAAGAIAVALAAAEACRTRELGQIPDPADMLDTILSRVPESAVADGIRQARDLPEGTLALDAALALGNGSRVTVHDTVPYTLWCAAHHLDNFAEAMWTTVSGFGDLDTTCAIVGGIVACNVGAEGIPPEWIGAREPLPDWEE